MRGRPLSEKGRIARELGFKRTFGREYINHLPAMTHDARLVMVGQARAMRTFPVPDGMPFDLRQRTRPMRPLRKKITSHALALLVSTIMERLTGEVCYAQKSESGAYGFYILRHDASGEVRRA